MTRQVLRCNECGYVNSEKEYRLLHIYINSETEKEILCSLCFNDLKRQRKEMEKKRKRSKVPIV